VRRDVAEPGRTLAAKLNTGHGPRCVLAPLRGLSALSGPGAPFHDPDADRALFDAVRAELSREVELVEVDCHINGPAFAVAPVSRFEETFELSGRKRQGGWRGPRGGVDGSLRSFQL
jgi:uncharacterized protein (UPF0261 family)